jgi:type II secretory pathway predicted ATPase ExeA
MTRLETFVNLGHKRDPFREARFGTGDQVRVMRILTMAIESRAMVSIVGERGIGKSDAVHLTLEKLGVRRVVVNRAQKEKITIADIEKAIILDLSDESPKRGAETCSRQVRRIIGEASRKQQIVLIIEEAQRLHSSTLRSLKTLREIEWMGEKELFTIILVAQSDPMNRAGVSEVRLRSDLVRMQGMSANEAGHYIRSTVGKHFDAAAVDALAELPQARNYLELQEVAIELLNTALADGREQVNSEDVKRISCQQPQPVPKTAPRKQAAALTGSDALKSVLGRKAGEAEQKGAINA